MSIRSVVIALLLLAPFATAAAEPVYTYVSHWTVPRAHRAQFEEIADQVKPVMDELLENGTIVHSGVESAFVHHEGSRTHAIWFTSTSLENLAKAQEASSQGSPNPAMLEVTGHHDHIFVSTLYGGRTSSGSGGYSSAAIFVLKPGMEAEWQSLMDTYMKPHLDEQVRAGNVLFYDIGEEYTHTGNPLSRIIWSVAPNAAALDASNTAFAKLQEENPAMWEAIEATHVRSSHSDRFYHVLGYGHR